MHAFLCRARHATTGGLSASLAAACVATDAPFLSLLFFAYFVILFIFFVLFLFCCYFVNFFSLFFNVFCYFVNVILLFCYYFVVSLLLFCCCVCLIVSKDPIAHVKLNVLDGSFNVERVPNIMKASATCYDSSSHVSCIEFYLPELHACITTALSVLTQPPTFHAQFSQIIVSCMSVSVAIALIFSKRDQFIEIN